MGRHAKAGFRVFPKPGTRFLYVSFTHNLQRFFVSTGKTDAREAQEEAGRIYAEIVKGGARPRSGVVLSREPLDVLFARWLVSLEGVLDPQTIETYEVTYVGTHWTPFFANVHTLCEEKRLAEYGRSRLRQVTRSTVRKELSALHGFVRWCEEQKIIAEAPRWPKLPPKATGKRVGTQRKKANEYSPEQVEAFLAALPELSSEGAGGNKPVVEDPEVVAEVRAMRERGMSLGAIVNDLNDRGIRRPRGGKWFASQVGKVLAPPSEKAAPEKKRKRFPVRARFVFAYETGLRPATLDAVVWDDWTGESLTIRDEDDKARFGRPVPLSERAIEVLKSLRGKQPGSALIFGLHDYRSAVAKAAAIAGLSKTAPYDFRHARGTHLMDGGASLPGVAYLLGHTQVTTTNKYVRPTERAARAALAHPVHREGVVAAAPEDATTEAEEEPLSEPTGGSAEKDNVPVPFQTPPDDVRRRGLEPLRELPHWNLNPPDSDVHSENEMVGGVVIAAGNRRSGHDSVPLKRKAERVPPAVRDYPIPPRPALYRIEGPRVVPLSPEATRRQAAWRAMGAAS